MTKYNPYPPIKLEYLDIIQDERYQRAKEEGLITNETLALFQNYNICSALLDPKNVTAIHSGLFSLIEFANIPKEENYLVEYLISPDFPQCLIEERAHIDQIINMTEVDVEHALENNGTYPVTGLSSRR